MKIYIVSQAVEERMHTCRLLKAAGIPFTLVLDSAQQAATARKLGHTKLMVTDTTDLPSKRNLITEHHGRGWYIGMDDNIQAFTAILPKFRKEQVIDTADGQNWRPTFNAPCKPREYAAMLEQLACAAAAIDTAYAGVATMENPFFRGKRYGLRRFVKSKVFCMDARGGVLFRHRMCHDSYASAHCVALHGRVLVDNWLFYRARWYERGGLGTMQQRRAGGFEQQLQAIIAEFPGLVGRARGKNSALRFLLTSNTAVNRWRAQHGWLKG